MTEIYRTPDECFEGLVGWEHEPLYTEVGGIRLARYETGEGPPVLFLHGEPTWSYVWRKLFPPLLEAGFRCVSFDHAGFGRSDKPLDPGWHGLERHVGLTTEHLDQLEFSDVTLVIHDWGGLIGFHTALRRPEEIARLVVLDTAIDPASAWMTKQWVEFRRFVERTSDLPVAEMMRMTCVSDPGAEVLAGYEVPFPTVESKAGIRGLPMSVPEPSEATAADADAVFAALRADERPMLMLWAADDMFLTLASGQQLASRLGRRIDHVLSGAGHGLPEDQGPLIGRLIADWLSGG